MHDAESTLLKMLNKGGFRDIDSYIKVSGFSSLSSTQLESFMWGFCISIMLGDMFYQPKAFETYKGDGPFKNFDVYLSVLSGNGQRSFYVHFSKQTQ